MSTSPLVNLDSALRGGSDVELGMMPDLALEPQLQPAIQLVALSNADPSSEMDTIVPPVPETLDETGLPGSMLEHLILKLLYSRGEMLGRDLSKALGLKFSVVEEFIEFLKRQHLIQAKSSLGMGNSTTLFALTEAGRSQARDCLENNQYSGPAPVPLYQYTLHRSAAAAQGRLADAGSAGARLPQDDHDAAGAVTNRAGGQFRQLVLDLRPARQWQDLPGRSAWAAWTTRPSTFPTRSSARVR